MKRTSKCIAVMAAAILAAGCVHGAVVTAGADDEELPDACETQPGQQVEIATAKLIIEFNSTDNDLGVHGAFDDAGWSELCVLDPTGRPVAVFDPQGALKDLTMAGVFFESREPPGSEYSMENLAADFPEGEYTVRAKSFDGTILVGSATFTHAVPAPPTITAPAIAEDPASPGAAVAKTGLAVAWEPVTETVDGAPVTITGYEVIVTKVNSDDPNGFSKPIYDVHVPAAVNSLSVPIEFLEPNTVYELEVLALEHSGNQTISVGFFVTD